MGRERWRQLSASRFRFDALKGSPIAGGNNRTRRVVGGERAGEISGVIVASSHPRHRSRSPPVPAVPSPLLVQRGEVKGGGLYLNILIMHALCKLRFLGILLH